MHATDRCARCKNKFQVWRLVQIQEIILCKDCYVEFKSTPLMELWQALYGACNFELSQKVVVDWTNEPSGLSRWG